MKISTVVEAGTVQSIHISSWSGNEMELQTDSGTIKVDLTEEIISSLHKRLEDKLVTMAKKRRQAAIEEVEDGDDE